jgi:hypothetical protein
MSAAPAISAKTGVLHRIWFPLRSNVGYFEGVAHSLDLEARIKQAALLAEELAFELGLLDVTVSESGMWSFWIPPNQLSEEDIIRRRQATKKGEMVSFAIGPESSPGVPAEPSAMHTMMAGPLQHAFVAEYHLLLRDTGLENVSWVKWAAPPPEVVQEAKTLAARESSAEGIGSSYTKLPRLSENRFLDSHLKKDLNFDLALGSLIGAPVAIDELRRPVLAHKTADPTSYARGQSTPGMLALYALAPNFTALPWPDIIALHDHDAIGVFRARMVEFEHEVADRPQHEWAEAIKDLGLEEAIAKANERLGRPRRIVGEIAVDLAAGLLPGVSQALTATKGLAKAQKAHEERRREWTAILMALRLPRRKQG